MVTIEQAVEELDERIEIWEDWNRKHPSGELGITWRDVMVLCRDIIEEREQNRELLQNALDYIEQHKTYRFTADMVKEILQGFHFGGAD